MDIPKEITTDQQLHYWNAVNQCKARMEHLKNVVEQTIRNVPPPVQQLVYNQMLSEMQHLASTVLNIRSGCQHSFRTWRESDEMTVIDISQCVICQLYTS